MGLEVDYITVGDASTRLNTPTATLRHWAEQLEEFDTHYLLRNNRNERIFTEDDIKVFEYLRDLKNEYGRRTTTKDIASMILDRGHDGQLKLRTKDDAPSPQKTNRTADLLSQEDIKRLMGSERVKQYTSVVVGEATKNIQVALQASIEEKLEDEFSKMNQKMAEKYSKLEETVKKLEEERDRKLEERMKQTDEYLSYIRERDNKPWWKKIFS